MKAQMESRRREDNEAELWSVLSEGESLGPTAPGDRRHSFRFPQTRSRIWLTENQADRVANE